MAVINLTMFWRRNVEDFGTGLQSPVNAIRAKWVILVEAWKNCVPFEG